MPRSANPGARRAAAPRFTQRISTTGTVKAPKMVRGAPDRKAKPMKGERKSGFQIK